MRRYIGTLFGYPMYEEDMRKIVQVGDGRVLAVDYIEEVVTSTVAIPRWTTATVDIGPSNFPLMNEISRKRYCSYCGSDSFDDSRGNCICCGGPRN